MIVGVVRKDSERGFMENLRSWLNVLVFPLNGKMNGFSLNGEGLQDQFWECLILFAQLLIVFPSLALFVQLQNLLTLVFWKIDKYMKKK